MMATPSHEIGSPPGLVKYPSVKAHNFSGQDGRRRSRKIRRSEIAGEFLSTRIPTGTWGEGNRVSAKPRWNEKFRCMFTLNPCTKATLSSQ